MKSKHNYRPLDSISEGTSNLVVGVAIGGLIGAGAALLLAPKSGCELREDIGGLYDDASYKLGAIAENIVEKTHNLTGNSNSYLNKSKRFAKRFYEEEENNHGLLAGAIIGGLVGVGTALLLAPKSGHQMRHDVGNLYEKLGRRTKAFAESIREREPSEWVDSAQELVDYGLNTLETLRENSSKAFVPYIRKIGDVLEWTEIGLKVLKNFQSARR